MKTTIKRQQDSKEFYLDERCYITEISNTADDEALSIARARLEPGITTRWHRLQGIAERYYILSGSGVVEIGGLPPTVVTAGDAVLIPPMCRQRITNNGTDDLVFLALCTPRFQPDAYEDIEEIEES